MKHLLTAVTLVFVSSSVSFAEPAKSVINTPAAFCAALKERLSAFSAKCEVTPQTKSEISLLKSGLESDSCDRYLKNVTIDAEKIGACLDEAASRWNAAMAIVQSRSSCRAAMQGQLKTGEKCFYDLQCPAGAFCVAKPDGTDPLDNYCSPVIQEGTPCANGSGSTCGTALTCVEGKCAPKLKKGDSCEPTSQICEGDLTCLLNKSTDKTGKCGVLRKAGEACHRWTECEGRCSSRNKKTQDGKCVSFCGSK